MREEERKEEERRRGKGKERRRGKGKERRRGGEGRGRRGGMGRGRRRGEERGRRGREEEREGGGGEEKKKYLLSVRLRETAPLPICVSNGPKTNKVLLACDEPLSGNVPFSPILFLSMEWRTSSGTVTLPSAVFTGFTLTGSHVMGAWEC